MKSIKITTTRRDLPDEDLALYLSQLPFPEQVKRDIEKSGHTVWVSPGATTEVEVTEDAVS